MLISQHIGLRLLLFFFTALLIWFFKIYLFILERGSVGSERGRKNLK